MFNKLSRFLPSEAGKIIITVARIKDTHLRVCFTPHALDAKDKPNLMPTAFEGTPDELDAYDWDFDPIDHAGEVKQAAEAAAAAAETQISGDSVKSVASSSAPPPPPPKKKGRTPKAKQQPEAPSEPEQANLPSLPPPPPPPLPMPAPQPEAEREPEQPKANVVALPPPPPPPPAPQAPAQAPGSPVGQPKAPRTTQDKENEIATLRAKLRSMGVTV